MAFKAAIVILVIVLAIYEGVQQFRKRWQIVNKRRNELPDAATLDDCVDVYEDTNNDAIKNEAIVKVVALLKAQLEKASTIEQCLSIYRVVGDASIDWDEVEAVIAESQNKALTLIVDYNSGKKVLDSLIEQEADATLIDEALRKTYGVAKFQECLEIMDDLDHSDYQSDAESELWNRTLSLAADQDDCQELLDRIGEEDFEEKINEKKIGYLDSVEDCESIWNDSGIDSHLGELAICRAADLIRVAAREKAEKLQAV